MADYFVHPSSYVDEPSSIGKGTRIWHFSHVMSHAVLGEYCILGQNVHIANDVKIGSHVKIQNNVSIYQGVVLEDYVFCGPSCVFTNVTNPRSEIYRHNEYKITHVGRGATIGANATIVCGGSIGRYAFIGAGAVVLAQRIPDYALMLGVPAVQTGWMGRHGFKLQEVNPNLFVCPASGWRYEKISDNGIRCIDWPEDKDLPEQETGK